MQLELITVIPHGQLFQLLKDIIKCTKLTFNNMYQPQTTRQRPFQLQKVADFISEAQVPPQHRRQQKFNAISSKTAFSLTPGVVKINPFNYLTGIGKTQWESATRKLHNNTTYSIVFWTS